MIIKLKFFLLYIFASLPTINFGQGSAEETNKLRDKIQILNLIIGLELDKEQANFIVEKNKEMTEAKNEFQDSWSEINDEYATTLIEIEKNLIEQGEIPKGLKRKYHQVHEKFLDIRHQFENKQKGISLDVMDQLKGYQLYAMEEFKPCIIPPEGPIRIGQADNKKGIGELLERIRYMPNNVYEFRKEEIAGNITKRIVEHLPRGYVFDEENEKERLITIFNHMRKMPEVDFIVEKDIFIKEIRNEATLPKPPIELWVKVHKYLLVPETAQVISKIY